VPNQLGVDYDAHLIDSVLRHLAPDLGWRWDGRRRGSAGLPGTAIAQPADEVLLAWSAFNLICCTAIRCAT